MVHNEFYYDTRWLKTLKILSEYLLPQTFTYYIQAKIGIVFKDVAILFSHCVYDIIYEILLYVLIYF